MEASQTPPQAIPPSTEPIVSQEQLDQLLAAQAAQREQLTRLRQELDTAQAAVPQPRDEQSPEALLKARLQELANAPYYCPGCGRTAPYQRQCTGKSESPHPPIEVVSTDEVKDPPPKSDKVAYQLWQQDHTAAP